MEIKDSSRPSFQILICMIKVWTMADPDKPLDIPEKPMIITECENIEIEDSYKELVGKASVKFPRGTVIYNTITPENVKKTNITASMDSGGVVQEIRKDITEVARNKHFSVGQRIRIYLGYTEDPRIADMAKISHYNSSDSIFRNLSKRTEYEKYMDIMFDGYITQISTDTPIELKCENLASNLKFISCPNKVTLHSKSTVNDFLSSKGRFHMLKGTGLELYPGSEEISYDLGQGIELHSDLTVADVLSTWAERGLYSFVITENNKPYLAFGRSYFYNAKKDSIIGVKGTSTSAKKIYFDYNVASNNLTLTQTEKKYLAVEAQGLDKRDRFYRLTVILNPDYKPGDPNSDKFRVVNDDLLSSKMIKLKRNKKNKINTKMYNIISYISSTRPVDKATLIKEASNYLENYNTNGIEGTLTLFGDLHLSTASKVELIDNRYPGKNGIYIVSEVSTTFGQDGYRQRIKLPYCISRKKKENGTAEK